MIQYIERSLRMPAHYFIIAIVVGVGIGLWKRSWKAGILVGYMFVLFSSMVLNRETYSIAMTRLEPFETYKDWPKILPETVMNVCSFIPIGILGGRKWNGIIIGAGFSLLIEITQLITRRGFFEVDDLINNTMGTLIGVCICKIVFYLINIKRLKPE